MSNYSDYSSANGRSTHSPLGGNPGSTRPLRAQTQYGDAINHPSALGGRNAQLQEALAAFSPSLALKSSDELFSLLTVEKDFEEFFESIPEVINQKINLKDFKSGNEELAKDNLNYRERLEQLRSEVEVKCQKISELEKQFQELKQTESSLIERYHPSKVSAKLKEEKMLIDSESSELTARFLRKELPLDEYIQTFRFKRTNFHQYELRLNEIDKQPLPVLDCNGISVKFLEK